MEMILGTRAQVLAQLRASGFIKSKGQGDIKYVNANSDNWAVVKAAIVSYFFFFYINYFFIYILIFTLLRFYYF